MAPTAAPLRMQPRGFVLKPSGLLIIGRYLAPKVLGGYTTIDPGLVEEGVDVLATGCPAGLLFHPVSRTGHGKVGGYFYGHYPIGDVWHWQVPGGCWARYGTEKGYVVRCYGGAMETVAFRRRFAFHVSCGGDDGREVLRPTPWLMKEYRLNKGAAVHRAAAARAQARPWANMDCVVRKVFAILPPPLGKYMVWQIPASRYPGGGGEAGYASDKESRTRSASPARIGEEPGRKRARLV